MSSKQQDEEISSEIRPAGLFKRFLAFLFDHFFLLLMVILVWIVVSVTTGINLVPGEKAHIVISILIFTIYFTILESSNWQASLGKKLMGLKVVNSENERLSLSEIIIRTICKGVLYFLNVFLVISMIKDDNNQMRYDKIVNSYVIDTNKDTAEEKKGNQVINIAFGVITILVSYALLLGIYIGSYVCCFKYAQYVHHNGNTKQAVKIFSSMLGKYPSMEVRILFARGDYYRKLGKYKLAIEDLKKCLKIKKKDGYSKEANTFKIYRYLSQLYKKMVRKKLLKNI